MMAVHAKDVLQKAKKIKKFNFKKYDYVIGTTCKATKKDDYFLRMTTELSDLKKKIDKKKGEVAIVFGSEPDGLQNPAQDAR